MQVKDDTAKVNLHENHSVDYQKEFEIERQKFQQETLRTSQLMGEITRLKTQLAAADEMEKMLQGCYDEQAYTGQVAWERWPIIEKCLAYYRAAKDGGK